MIKTNNIYYAAYLFTEAMPFTGAEVKIDPSYGRTVMFSFTGADKEKEIMASSSFDDNVAEVNLSVYLESLGLVRDITNRMMKQNEHNQQKRFIGKAIKLPRIK